MKFEKSYIIRKYNSNDKKFIYNLHKEVYHTEYNYDNSFNQFIESTIDGFIQRNIVGETILICEVAQKPIGSISIKKVTDEISQIGLFILDPVFRGQGYAQKMLEAAIDFSKENNYKSIQLITNSDLIAAWKIYKKFGFLIKASNKVKLSNIEMTEELWELSIE